MATTIRRMNLPALKVAYDRPVDVLHITIGEATAYEGEGLPRGVEIDYAVDNGVPCGAKVIGFERNGWSEETKALAALLSRYLDVSATDIAIAIVKAAGK